jgi:hypothetical protein
MADGPWDSRSFAGGPILIRVRGFCGTGFIVKFLIFEAAVQEL